MCGKSVGGGVKCERISTHLGVRRRLLLLVFVLGAGPAALAARIARVTSEAQGIWAEARAADDVAAFAPTLAEVIALKREEGQALAAGGDVYDAMLDDYEPGARAAELEAMFGALRPELTRLREAVRAAEAPPVLEGRFDAETQMKLTRQLATTFGYDMTMGRVDKAVHPFSSGSGLDVRITTRTELCNPSNCFYSTIHEVGHATYEQNVDRAYLLTPLGRGASMGVHESQSLFFEMQLGRSLPFLSLILPQIKAAFNCEHDPAFELENLHKLYTRVQPGLIRVDADEVTYPAHVILRYEIEQQLIQQQQHRQTLTEQLANAQTAHSRGQSAQAIQQQQLDTSSYHPY